MRRIIILAGLSLFLPVAVHAQKVVLRQKIEQLISSKNASIGVAIIGIESGDTLEVNGTRTFPMLSVFKFHLALAVLHQVDEGKLRLNQKIFVSKSALLPNTWSPLREKYPEGNVWLPLSDLIAITVSKSDNNGCDLLLKLIGGTKVVDHFIHSLGIDSVSIVANEAEMHQAWSNQYKNRTSPLAASTLLAQFYRQQVVSPTSFDFLWKIMSAPKSYGHRIHALLPDSVVVAHKTGTSDTNADGLTAAVNDIGIVCLPNGKHFAISVFVTDSKENYKTNEQIIGEVAKLAWDYFRS